MLNLKKFIILAIFTACFLFAGQAKAVDSYCFCHDDVSKINTTNYKTLVLKGGACIKVTDSSQCKAKEGNYKDYDTCDSIYSTLTSCADAVTIWKKAYENAAKGGAIAETETTGGLVGKFIPSCVMQDTLSGNCRDIGIFVVLAMNIAKYLFTIVGALALIMFIYGGITLIISQGNPEKTKKGFGILTAALIGIIIIF